MLSRPLSLDYGSSLPTGPRLIFHSAMLVTTSWLSVGGLSGSLLVTSVSTFACATPPRLSSSPNSRLQIQFLVDAYMTGPLLFCAPWASLISFSISTLATSAGTIPSRASYILFMPNTLISPHMIPLEWLC
jgi:hypothetical protein